MNRREFTKSLVAASVTPALPLKALAKAAPAVTLAKDPMYIWASFVSRVHNKSSPAMISRLLKVGPDQGAKLYAQLLADGALTAPDAFGLSQSTNPLYPEYSRVMGHGKQVIKTLNKTSKTDGLEDMLNDNATSEDAQTPDAPLEVKAKPEGDGAPQPGHEGMAEPDGEEEAVGNPIEEDEDFTSS